jgi:BlaI family penicillinase repressor
MAWVFLLPVNYFQKKKPNYCFVRKLSYLWYMETGKDDEIKKTEPTKGELEILQVLWQHGPNTVRFVNDRLNEQREINYTSTLKLMQIMADKGMLKRDESQMKHIYHVIEAEEKTKDHLLERFVDSVYNGSASKLVMQLLGNKKASKDELARIRAMLDQLEKKQ